EAASELSPWSNIKIHASFGYVMKNRNLNALGFKLRIAGNLVLATSLGIYLLTLYQPESSIPQWIPLIFAFVGVGLIMTAIFIRVIPPSEKDIREEFERESSGDDDIEPHHRDR